MKKLRSRGVAPKPPTITTTEGKKRKRARREEGGSRGDREKNVNEEDHVEVCVIVDIQVKMDESNIRINKVFFSLNQLVYFLSKCLSIKNKSNE